MNDIASSAALLKNPQFDVVAGVHEDLVTTVAQRFHQNNPTSSLFKGTFDIAALELRIDYEFSKAPTFDFSPLARSENVAAAVEAIKVAFSDTESGESLAKVVLGAKARGEVTFAQGSLRFRPSEVNLEISSQDFATRSHRSCDLDKLIKHVLNAFLRSHIETVFASIPIPNPPDFVTGFSLSIEAVDFSNNFLLVGMRVQDRRLEDNAPSGVFRDEVFHGLFSDLPELRQTTDQANSTIDATIDFSQVRTRTEGFTRASGQTVGSTKGTPSGDFNLFLAMSKRAFQRLADLQLNRKDEKSKSENGDGTYWWYKYGIEISNSLVDIVSSGLRVAADVRLWADAEAGKHIFWPIGWVRVGAEGRGSQRIGINANLFTRNAQREVWLNPQIDSIGSVKVRFTFRPSLIQWLIGWMVDVILRGLYSLLLGLLALGSMFLKIKLYSVPETLPVSGIAIHPKSVTLGNWDERLLAGIKIEL